MPSGGLKETPEEHDWKEGWTVGVTLHSNCLNVGSEVVEKLKLLEPLTRVEEGLVLLIVGVAGDWLSTKTARVWRSLGVLNLQIAPV